MENLLKEIRSCQVCAPYLKNGVNPVLSVSQNSKIIIIGQAPGSVVHRTGVPWDDRSGERLRNWMGVTNQEFYDTSLFGIVPMGFCYPGKGKSGDLAPRKECAPLWHDRLFDQMKDVKLVLLIGSYAQKYYLKDKAYQTLTDTVSEYRQYLPEYFPLPHPSPRNNIWLKKNDWFPSAVLPELKRRIQKIKK